MGFIDLKLITNRYLRVISAAVISWHFFILLLKHTLLLEKFAFGWAFCFGFLENAIFANA